MISTISSISCVYRTTENCCSENFTSAWIQFDRSYSPDSDIQRWLDELQVISSEVRTKLARVTLVGRFDGCVTNGCYGPRDSLLVTNIEQFEPLPEGL
jgi:hypothetical protein